MKKLFLIIISTIIIVSCGNEQKKDSKELLIRNFIDYCNKNEKSKIDSIISADFEFVYDTLNKNKLEYLNSYTNSGHIRKEIIEIKITKNIVKTKEKISNDVTNFLELEPESRTCEYYINEDNKINSFHILEYITPPENIVLEDKFLEWANENYPTLYKEFTKKANEDKNVDEERKFLLMKIREVGIQVLKKKEPVLQEEEINKQISITDFRKSVIGKTKKQIKKMYGKPCSSQSSAFIGTVWYYGRSSCFNQQSRTIIFDEDSEKEVSQAQILFSGDIATTVNF